jgi:hypothetical protein
VIYGHILENNFVEKLEVGILKLGQINILFKGSSLASKLLNGSFIVNVFVEASRS